jgi:hypothetical protein
VETQVRIYEIAQGHLDEFVAAWSSGVRPLRERHGFSVLGAWSIPDTSQFVWVLGFDGEGGFAAADAAYYATDERHRLEPDPAQWIESVQEHPALRVV